MNNTHPTSLTTLLEELLKLHDEERLCMKESRTLDHENCISKKLQKAIEVEKTLSDAAFTIQSHDMQLLAQVKMAAEANAAIASKMLESTRKKIDFIHKLASPSYGSNGKMNPPKFSGGLLDTKA